MRHARTIISVMLSVLISVLIAGTVGAGKAQTAKSDKTPKWETMANGVDVLRLQPSATTGQPQVAVLRLSPDQEAEFDKDPQAFLNKYGIFAQTVTVAKNIDIETPIYPTAAFAASSDKDKGTEKKGGGVRPVPKEKPPSDGGTKPKPPSDGGTKPKPPSDGGTKPKAPIPQCVKVCVDLEGTGKPTCYKVCN